MLLDIVGLSAGYRDQPVLKGVNLSVAEGEAVLLMGPNGAGKSTVLRCVSGLLPPWDGDIRFEGRVINNCLPAANVARGITMVPQGANVFADMTVAENISLGGFQLRGNEVSHRFDEVVELFPLLKGRLKQLAGTLSGGELQILAIARALVPNPRLLLLDEPTLGLGPTVVQRVFDAIEHVRGASNTAILMVEHRVRDAFKICDRVYSMKLGSISFVGTPNDLMGNNEKLAQLFL